jgi:hypothetical protein
VVDRVVPSGGDGQPEGQEEREKMAAERVVLVGHSLGTGVVGKLAGELAGRGE